MHLHLYGIGYMHVLSCRRHNLNSICVYLFRTNIGEIRGSKAHNLINFKDRELYLHENFYNIHMLLPLEIHCIMIFFICFLFFFFTPPQFSSINFKCIRLTHSLRRWRKGNLLSNDNIVQFIFI